jgi:hypothetical protein
MYEAWVETLGGILDVAGVPGLLGNADELLKEADKELPQWRAFAAAWWTRHRERSVGVRELFELATDQNLLPEVLDGKNAKAKGDDRSRRTRLGRALGRKRDCVCGAFRIESAGEDHSGCQQYKLKCLDPEAAARAPDDDQAEAGATTNRPRPITESERAWEG